MNTNIDLRTAELTANMVKTEAYQVRSELEELSATLNTITAKVFLGDRQIANQTTNSITQRLSELSHEVTSADNIVDGLDHETTTRLKLLEHRVYLNDMLTKVNKSLLSISTEIDFINAIRIEANKVTADLNSELAAELKRLQKNQTFGPFITRHKDEYLEKADKKLSQYPKYSRQHMAKQAGIRDSLSKLMDSIPQTKKIATKIRQTILNTTARILAK
jgi:hypothetical protein